VEQFIERHSGKIEAVLCCFDRLILKGHLSWVSYPSAMEWFLHSQGILFKDFKPFVLKQAERIKQHAVSLAARAGRPYRYLATPVRMEEEAQKMADEEGITRGLICVFSRIEPCPSYRLIYAEPKPRLISVRRKCLFLYFYFMDRRFGLMHVKLQTWFPFQMQIYINGHSWLARKMDRHGIRHQRIDNAFLWLENPARAQRLADNMVRQNWPRVLAAFARKVNPLLQDLFRGQSYYWVISQSEYCTDLLFRDRHSLGGLYKELLKHATLCLSAEDVLTFLGKKLTHAFQGEVLNDFKHREPGARVKHRMKQNWIKMYDKYGRVLRIETVINHPYDFKIRRRGTSQGKPVVGWFPMAKRVTNLRRYLEVSRLANSRYLQALSSVDDTSEAKKTLHQACKRVRLHGRSVRALNPLAPDDLKLFQAVLRGEYAILGFRNRHIRDQIFGEQPDPVRRRRLSARVSRLLKCLHAHSLIAKIPRSRRWRLTRKGLALMSAAIRLDTEYFPKALAAQPA
jgi:hypothetical protein